VTYCNSISVSEACRNDDLALVRNYLPSHQWVVDGGCEHTRLRRRSSMTSSMNVGTVRGGRIRAPPYSGRPQGHSNVNAALSTDRHRLPEAIEKELELTFHPTTERGQGMRRWSRSNAPLHPETRPIHTMR